MYLDLHCHVKSALGNEASSGSRGVQVDRSQEEELKKGWELQVFVCWQHIWGKA
jgi:hypothetical protein